MSVDASARLACGTLVAALVEQVADDLAPANPEHQLRCSYCQETLRGLEGLWGRVRELARQPVRAPYRVVQAVMRGIRAQSPLPVLLPLPLEVVVPALVRHALVQQERGSTRIADSVLARIVALSLREFPAVEPAGAAAETARGRFHGATRGIQITVSEQGVIVDLRITVEYGLHLPTLVGVLRGRIVEQLTRMTGSVVLEVNILVEDVRLPLGN